MLELTVSVSLVCVLVELSWVVYSSKDEVRKTAFFGVYFKTLATFSVERTRDFALKEEMCIMWVFLCFQKSFLSSFLPFFWTLTGYMLLNNILCSLMLSIFYLYGTFKKKRKMFPAVLCLDYISKV